jgi:teichuronic acid exporter
VTESTPTPAERAQLDRSFAGGIAWSGLARLSSQMVTWLVTLGVARLLVPADYGIVASATIYLGLVRLVTEFGLGTAIVTQRNLTDRQVSQLGGFAALLGVGAWVITFALAAPVAALLRVPALSTVLPVLGFATAVSTLNSLPTALLQRSLDYRSLSQLELLRSLAASLSLLLYAWLKFGYWALVLNEVTAVSVYAIALYLRTRYRLARPRLADIRSSLRLSGELVIARFASFAYTNTDVTIVARRFGAAVLGDYSMAWTLTSVPSEKLGSVLMSVTPGVLARVQHDTVELSRYFLLLIEGLSLLLLPATVGISLTAQTFIPLLLGEKWRGAIPIVEALGILLALRSISPVCGQVLVARLRSDIVMKYSIAAAVIMPISFLVGSHWGVMGVTFAWLTVSPMLSLTLFAITCREISLPVRQLLAVVARPLGAVLLMAVAVLAARAALASTTLPPASQLSALILTGAIVYLGTLALTMRDRVLRVWRLVRRRT